MERYKILIFLVLMLLPVCFAAENETIIQPTAPQTISIEKLISSMDAMKERIAGMETNLNELRVQLDSKLSTQYWGFVLFAAVYTVFILSLRGILSEVWTWWMFSRKKRKVEKFQERIAKELQIATAQLAMINASLASIKSDVVAVEKEKRPEEKQEKSWMDRLQPFVLIILFLSLAVLVYVIFRGN